MSKLASLGAHTSN